MNNKISALKEEIKELSQVLRPKRNDKIKEYIELTRADFINFFSSHGFKIQEFPQKIIAISQTENFSLEYGVIGTPYVATEMRLDLNLGRIGNFLIALNPRGIHTKVTSKILSHNPEQRLKGELDELKRDKEYFSSRIKNIENEIWDLELRLKSSKKTLKNNRFDSMKVLLESTVQL